MSKPPTPQPQVRIKEKDFIADPSRAYREAEKRPVVLTDDNDRSVAILSVPTEPLREWSS